MKKLLSLGWLIVLTLCVSPVAYATSIGTLDGSPINLPPGVLVENRVTPSPPLLLILLFYAQLGGLILLGLPRMIYRRMRQRWPQSAASRHRLFVSGGAVAVTLAAVVALRSGGAIRTQEFLILLAICIAGYTIMQLGDFLVVRRLWQRFARLPRSLRPVAVFMLPLILVWLGTAVLRAWVQQTIPASPIYRPIVPPDFSQGSPLPLTSPQDQPLSYPRPHLTTPPETQQ